VIEAGCAPIEARRLRCPVQEDEKRRLTTNASLAWRRLFKLELRFAQRLTVGGVETQVLKHAGLLKSCPLCSA
jgi:hypothetical protein